jgi:hypothetical protein
MSKETFQQMVDRVTKKQASTPAPTVATAPPPKPPTFPLPKVSKLPKPAR